MNSYRFSGESTKRKVNIEIAGTSNRIRFYREKAKIDLIIGYKDHYYCSKEE